MLGIRLLENYSAPSPDLQLVEGQKVRKRVGGDDGDVIIVQIPTDEKQLAGVWKCGSRGKIKKKTNYNAAKMG